VPTGSGTSQRQEEAFSDW